MRFNFADLESCQSAAGVLLIIDVLRAFSTAAYAFSRGAREIFLVSAVQEALDLKSKHPHSKVMGEVGGLPPEGFDFGNSPTRILEQDLKGITLIQRTAAGTQGVVQSVKGDYLFATSLVVASATVDHVRLLKPSEVTFVLTGGMHNLEDMACARYLEKKFTDQSTDPREYVQMVMDSMDAREHQEDHPQRPRSDLDYCTRIDCFDFAMPVMRKNGRFVMQAVKNKGG